MKTVIIGALVAVVGVALWAVLLTVVIYPSWNMGAAPAFGANEVTIAQAFWLSLFISAVGKRFQPESGS